MEGHGKLDAVQYESERRKCVFRIDTLSKKKKKFVPYLYFLATIIVLLSSHSGMHTPEVHRLVFDKKGSEMEIRKLDISLNNLSAVHSYIKMRIYLTRGEQEKCKNTTVVNVSLLTKTFSGNRFDETYVYNSRPFLFEFPENATESLSNVLYNMSTVSFDRFEAQAFLKYTPREKYSGAVECKLANYSFAVLSIAVRASFFAISLSLMLAYFVDSQRKKQNHVVRKTQLALNFMFVLSSNIFFSLTFLTDSRICTVHQSILDSTCLIFAFFVADVLAYARCASDAALTFSKMLITAIPYCISGFLTIFYYLVFQGQENSFFYFVVLLSHLACSCMALKTILYFETDQPLEKKAFLYTLCITIFALLYLNYYSFCKKETRFEEEQQLYIFMVIANYICFLNYMCWPSKISEAELDLELSDSQPVPSLI